MRVKRVKLAKLPNFLRSRRGLRRFAWGVLGYNVAVVVWGAFVRATGSGAGCGRHWPLCNGEVLPRAQSMATVIEVTHRATSGVALLLVGALLIWSFAAAPARSTLRRAAAFSAAFMVGEALLGAGLVLFELVAHDASMKRALSMVLHLVNTLFLLGALAIAATSAERDSDSGAPREREREREREPRTAPAPDRSAALLLLPIALAAVVAVAATGALAALGDTLFPSRTLREGWAQDFSPTAPWLLRLRVLHPFLAVVSATLVLGAASAVRSARPSARRYADFATAFVVVQFCVGLLNLQLLAPVWMQLVHLGLAEGVWIALVLCAWHALYADRSGLSAVADRGSRPLPQLRADLPSLRAAAGDRAGAE